MKRGTKVAAATTDDAATAAAGTRSASSTPPRRSVSPGGRPLIPPQQLLKMDAAAAPQNHNNFSLYLPMPVTGMSVWDEVLLGAASVREHSAASAADKQRTRAKLSKQVDKAFEERRRQQEALNAQRNAELGKIGKAVARAADKAWTRARRGFEAKCALELDIEKQRSAEKRQASFLKDTEKLTAFLADSFRSLTANISGSSNANDGDDDLLQQQQQQQQKEFEHTLTLLNTLDGTRPLRPYQRSALAFLVNLYNNGLNGILADEMGLGKTVQTLALFAYFAEYKQDWGPHLVVVPASIVANWELECMRWVPGLKVLKYQGSAKERERLRRGWTAEGAFHICLVSYATVVQDRAVFKRRTWGFLVLDEAHQIKNWQSQKWQVLFEMQASHRLLLTGTPLQTSVMELWALLRFIVPPHVAILAAQKHLQQQQQQQQQQQSDQQKQIAAAFENMEDFQRWFSDPLTAMVAGQAVFDGSVVARLHTLLRPFFYRRLKCDVETQLPPKTEVVVLCPLSRRQRMLYHDFLALGDTRQTLACGSYLGVVRVLLALRKVCNHPDLFAERPVASPLVLDPQNDRLVVPCPRAALLLHDDDAEYDGGDTDETGRTRHRRKTWLTSLSDHWSFASRAADLQSRSRALVFHVDDLNLAASHQQQQQRQQSQQASSTRRRTNAAPQQQQLADFVQRFIQDERKQKEDEALRFLAEVGLPAQQQDFASSNSNNNNNNNNSRVQRVVDVNASRSNTLQRCRGFVVPTWCCAVNVFERAFGSSPDAPARKWFLTSAEALLASRSDLLSHFVVVVPKVWARAPILRCRLPVRVASSSFSSSSSFRISHAQLLRSHAPTSLFVADPHDVAHQFALHLRHECAASNQGRHRDRGAVSRMPASAASAAAAAAWWPLAHYFHFPESRWVVQDCGKFYVLLPLFKRLAAEGHRVLIFTQFTAMLAILERFLAFMGLPYLRLDGATAPDERQFRVEQFNRDARIFAMVLSTRSGGIGLNLIGADTVVFFDSDWNPAMDLQAQDRCHRIGQTRAVTIYRLVSEHTVEASIVAKARQRKMLNNLVIRSGQFHRQVGEVSAAGSGAGSGAGGDDGGDAAAAAAANSMNREALLKFFHDRDEGAEETTNNSNALVAAAVSGDGASGPNDNMKLLEVRRTTADNDDTQQQHQQQQQQPKSADEQEWQRATEAAEDAEDRDAGSAAVAEQRTVEASDWLGIGGGAGDGVIDGSGGGGGGGEDDDDDDREKAESLVAASDSKHDRQQHRQQQRHVIKRNFAALANDPAKAWPPAMHADAGINQRLVHAIRCVTNTPIEAWAAATVPFFDRGSASAIRAKVGAVKK